MGVGGTIYQKELKEKRRVIHSSLPSLGEGKKRL